MRFKSQDKADKTKDFGVPKFITPARPFAESGLPTGLAHVGRNVAAMTGDQAKYALCSVLVSLIQSPMGMGLAFLLSSLPKSSESAEALVLAQQVVTDPDDEGTASHIASLKAMIVGFRAEGK